MPLLVLNLLVIVGTLGFMIVEGWSLLDALYMTVITMTTIGFGEVQPLSSAGRWFTVAFILTGIGLATGALSTVARYVSDGRLVEEVRARSARLELNAMRNHDIVIGYGRLGREIVLDLIHHGSEVLVIDLEPIEDLPEGVSQLVGDGTLDVTLREAGIEHARGLAIATPMDAVNVYITLSARQLNVELIIQTRVEDDGAAVKARRAGADGVVMPFHIGGGRIAQALLRPHASAFVDRATQRHFDDLHLEDVLVGANEAFHGPLRDLDLRNSHGVSVVALQRLSEEGLIYPDATTVVHEGDTLVVVGSPEKVRGFAEDAR